MESGEHEERMRCLRMAEEPEAGLMVLREVRHTDAPRKNLLREQGEER